MSGTAERDQDARQEKYGCMPSPVRIEDTTTSQETRPVPVTEAKRDPECEFIRFS